ncbi:acylhydrolase [Mucilaginibacter limnophilus]|uniref:Acylhydrolase n=2 Tax=Mucilaginibacter limnophilus TaxID=1932778 RepID=A0A437MU40_9SPHI|nr:acylhydrolase [Mucilaginibacter limnophilus]
MFYLPIANAQEKTDEQKQAEAWENFQKMIEKRHHNDWAWLDRYRADNAKIDLSNSKTRVVFMGNSITDGWDEADPGFFESNPFINRGIGGQTTPQMLVRFRADVINLKPKAVVILAGVNDIAGNTGPSTLEMIEDNLMSMTELARANGIKVILCSLLPAIDFPWAPGKQPAPKIIELNSWIKRYAAANNFSYVDYHSAMADEKGGLKKEYTKDGVHPTVEGYAVMKPLVLEAINKVLKTK